ncbi:NXN protein, partial [Trypanosoma rangeli]
AMGADASKNLDSEVVQEQEQEEQRVSVASRDDEFHIPWRVETLETHGRDYPTQGSCFYPLRRLRVRPQRPLLFVDSAIQVSDNNYREAWHGAGERRLKNVFLSLEWLPLHSSEDEMHVLHFGLVTLAEGESLRWMMHHPTHLSGRVCMALRVVSSGRYMDVADSFALAVPRLREERTSADLLPAGAAWTPSPAPSVERNGALLLYRFLSNDMFFSPGELAVLEEVVRNVAHMDRLQFFTDCLRARRRHRNHWEDAPVAALFLPAEHQEAMRPLAILTALRVGFEALPERAAQVPPAAKLVAQLRSLHERVAKASKEQLGGTQSTGASTASLPIDMMARILHDIFPSVVKPFTPHDVEHALRYLCHHGAAGAGTRTPADVGHPHHAPLHRVAEAFPVLQEEFLHTCLAASRVHGGFQEER